MEDITEHESAALEASMTTTPYVLTESKPQGFFADSEDSSCSVKVAMRIRPMVGKEMREGNQKSCITTTPELGKLQIGSKEFFFDRVFDIESNQEDIFDVCAYNLVLGCFCGYNATILAYGQTGSGKTHTMGTGSTVGLSMEQIGIVPRVFDFIFDELENRRRQSEFSQFELKVQFLELYGEELHDLLDTTSINKQTGQSSKQLQIREEKSGAISIQNLKGEIVTSKEECTALLNKGISQRVTSSTLMNEGSSRSHAIFTVTINQKIIKIEQAFDGKEPVTSEENISAKFHFVDLAGSERIKKTGATGKLMQEGISINKGLLALGNVIAALTDEKKIAAGTQFIPYRDSKLTRILQDSLGGNSRTTMIACASPSDSNLDESLSCIKYASRARNIKNKPIVNRDANSMLIEALKAQIVQLSYENKNYQALLAKSGVEIPEQFIKEVPKEKTQTQMPLQTAQNNTGPNSAQTQEIKDLKLKLARKEKELQELKLTNTESQGVYQTNQKDFQDLQQERDDLVQRQEALYDHLKNNNIAAPKELSQTDTSQAGGKRTQSLVDEYKAKLAKFTAEVAAKNAEILQKTKKIADLQTAMKRDEVVLKKAMEENERFKREGKRSLPAVTQPIIKEVTILDDEDMKSKFIDSWTSKLQNVFDSAPSQQERDQSQEILSQTQNSTLEDKEKFLLNVKQTSDQVRLTLNEMFESAWAQNTAEIKNKMKLAEADRKTKTTGADPKVVVQVEKEYKSKMDDLNKQLDSQQREKQRKEEQISKQIFMQEARIKSLEQELAKERKEKEEIQTQRKYGEERFHKLKNTVGKEVQFTKKQSQEKDKTVQKLKQDLKKTEQMAAQKINELKAIQKRALDEKIRREHEEQSELDSKGIDIDAIKDWIKQSTEALLNQQELRNYLKEQRKARDDINEEMLQEGDRFTELMVQKQRLEIEREQLIEEVEKGFENEVRLLEIDSELNEVVIESDSIDQTLDTLEEHYRYVSDKIQQLNDQINAFDPESIKPPGFKGLNSVEMARATLKTFFAVLLDLNVYKRDLETKCIEQDETIIGLERTVNVLQEKIGITSTQREAIMQKQRVISQVVNSLGDRVEFMDNREITDMGLSKDEQNQLTKMSLSKIVGNLRQKLKDEEKRTQSLSLKIEQLLKEKELVKDKLTQIKREQKFAEPIKNKISSKSKINTGVKDDTDFFNQRRPDSKPQSDLNAQAPRRLSFKQRRDIMKEQNTDQTALERTQQNVDSLTKKPVKQRLPSSTSSLKDRRNQKRERPLDEIENDMSNKLEMLEKDVSNLNSKSNISEAQKKARKRQMQFQHEVVQEVDDSQEQSSEDEFSESSSDQEDEKSNQDEDLDAKIARAERRLLAEKDISFFQTSQQTDITVDEDSASAKKESAAGWKLQSIFDTILTEGNKIVDFDSCGDRLFVITSDAVLIEISMRLAQTVQQVNLREIDGIQFSNEETVLSFAVFRDLNMIAFSVQSAVFLVDFEKEIKYCNSFAVSSVTYLTFVELQVVMMITSEEDSSEAVIKCYGLNGGEEGAITIKRFMEQSVLVRPNSNSVVFACGNQIGRVLIPEMEIQFQSDSEHVGAILDFEISDTCIFTTGADLSLRVFDIENGMMLIAPMEEMECDKMAIHGEYLVTRCGQGQAIVILKYTDGAENLEDVDFIDLQSADNGSAQSEPQQERNASLMKGGHKLVSAQGESDQGVILVADQNAQRLSVRMLKNRSYIT